MSEAGGTGKPNTAVAAVLFLAGLTAVVGGIAVMSWPAAVVAVGVVLVLAAIDLRR